MIYSNLEIIKKLMKCDLDKYQNLSDLLDMLKIYEKEGFGFSHKLNRKVRYVANRQARNKLLSAQERVKFLELYKKSLLFDALYEFNAYLLYIEFDRPAEKKFYVPRIDPLSIVVNDLQDLYDHKIKFLAISLPPRVGKSTLGIFFLTWLMGKHPDLPSLMTGYSDTLVKGFQKEAVSIINSEEYLWHEVFPEHKIKKISSEFGTVDIDRERRFATLTCRSIEGSLTGSVDIKCLGYVDDVVSDHEEACNEERMNKKMFAYANQVKDRMVGDFVMELHIGTRWGVDDVIGRLQDQYKDDPRYRFRIIPAMNDDDESNFDYPFDLGFSTEKYRDIRATLEHADDIASWYAKYMGEPYVREGLVFPEIDLEFFDGYKQLPDGEPVKYIACDVAWGGGDSLSSPVGYVYGEEVYVVDWLFSKGDKDETRPQMKALIMAHKPDYVRFEANNGGDMYGEDIDRQLREEKYRFNIESILTKGGVNASKHAEILAYAPDIKKWHFLSRKYRTSDYDRAMRELCRYTRNGKVKHDDAPDSLKQLAKMIINNGTTYEICERPF